MLFYLPHKHSISLSSTPSLDSGYPSRDLAVPIRTAITISILVFNCWCMRKWCCKKRDAPVTSGSGQPVYVQVSGCSCCYLSLSFTLFLCHHHTVFLLQDPVVMSEPGYSLQPQFTVRDSGPYTLKPYFNLSPLVPPSLNITI